MSISKVSTECVNLVKSFEGFSAKIYKDSVGIPTLGYGMTGDLIKGLTTITEPKAAIMLENLLNSNYASPVSVKLNINKIILNQNQFDALISMSYNIGVGGLLGSTLFADILRGVRDSATITKDFQAWDKAGSNVLAGLLKRRNAEAALFLSNSIIVSEGSTAGRRYTLAWQKFYNEVTQTIRPLIEDGVYGESTKTSLDEILAYIKKGKGSIYCLHFQIFYNDVTQTSAPLVEDGEYGDHTLKAFQNLNEQIKS